MKTELESFYVSGRVPHHERGQFQFELERAPNGLPYVTRHPAGAHLMGGEGWHLYKISEDFKKVFLIKSNQPSELDSPAQADLSPEQERELRRIVDTGKFIY